jgi:hypothetical protein
MAKSPSSSASVFRMLCRVLGGHDRTVLSECITRALLRQLFNMVHSQDLLPALAVRCNEQEIDTVIVGEERAGLLKQALRDNTLRNMKISAQRTFVYVFNFLDRQIVTILAEPIRVDLSLSDTQIGLMSGLALRRPQGTAAGLIR